MGMMSPSIAGGSPLPGTSGALSSLNLGDLENTEGLTAYEQILRLREVLASMRESAKMDAESAQLQLEEMQANAPDRIQEAYRRGTEQGKQIVEALVSQSRENLRTKMLDYRTRKTQWEKRLQLLQAGNVQIAPATSKD